MTLPADRQFLSFLLAFWSFLLRSKCLGADLPYLFFHGRILNDHGRPVQSAKVQFWHTDYNGNYDHPQNQYNGFDLVSDFAYFGTATTDSEGRFEFTTFRPGIYPSRPITHIHFKVWHLGYEYLTSQFYFADEPWASRNIDPMLVLDWNRMSDGNFETHKAIVIDLGNGGPRKRTPHQTEGPFYPVVDFIDFSDDLTVGVGEFATLFPNWGSSGSWRPRGVTDFPSTFSPTDEGISIISLPTTNTTKSDVAPTKMPSPQISTNETVALPSPTNVTSDATWFATGDTALTATYRPADNEYSFTSPPREATTINTTKSNVAPTEATIIWSPQNSTNSTIVLTPLTNMTYETNNGPQTTHRPSNATSITIIDAPLLPSYLTNGTSSPKNETTISSSITNITSASATPATSGTGMNAVNGSSKAQESLELEDSVDVKVKKAQHGHRRHLIRG